MFVSPARHDPGGKVRLPLMPGMRGDSLMSPCHRYRLWLSRTWACLGYEPRYALFIGHNPSTAEAHCDDPTIHKELRFTLHWKHYTGYFKANVFDYRATNPGALLHYDAPCSANNLPTIRRLANKAELIVVCFGELHPRLQSYGDKVVGTLIEDGHELWCLGVTKSGNPRHPLYLPYSAKLQRYDRRP